MDTKKAQYKAYKDYYGVMKVGKHFTMDELKKSYKRLAMKWHPFKNLVNQKKATIKFKRINEAYEVLSDPHKRAIFDNYGEFGLKGRPPEVGTGTQGSSTGGNTNMFKFIPRNAEDVFVEFWGGTSPFAGMAGDLNPRGHRCDRPVFPKPPPKYTCAVFVPTDIPKKPAPILKQLPCTLEELTLGCIKKIKLARITLGDDGQPVPVEDVLTITVKPGWKKGTKITFVEKGNQQPGQIPADLVFLIDEKPHPIFTRDGDDLIITKKINLSEALLGLTVTLTVPDYRILNIPCYGLIRPGFVKTVRKEGMPIFREPGKKGDLFVRFEIKFPVRNLTNEQKEIVKKCLPKSVY